jgi:hypothetical protein
MKGVMSKVIGFLLWIAFVVSAYAWVFVFLTVMSLIDHGEWHSLNDLYFVGWLIDAVSLVAAMMWLVGRGKWMNLRGFYAVVVIGFLASISSIVIRVLGFLKDESSEIFWFDPVLRGFGYLLIFALIGLDGICRKRSGDKLPGIL